MTLHKDHERALYSLQSAAKYLIFKGCSWSLILQEGRKLYAAA